MRDEKDKIYLMWVKSNRMSVQSDLARVTSPGLNLTNESSKEILHSLIF